MICSHIHQHLCDHNILSPIQYGFMKDKITIQEHYKMCYKKHAMKMYITKCFIQMYYIYIYKIMSCSTRNHWWDLMSYVHNTKSSKTSCIQLENLNNKTWIALPLTMSHKMWFVVIANVCCLLSIYTSIAWSWYIMSNSTFVHSAALQHEAVLGLVRWSYALRNALWVQYSSSMYWTGPFQHIKSPIEACALGGEAVYALLKQLI